jgi:hypothetical protein
MAVAVTSRHMVKPALLLTEAVPAAMDVVQDRVLLPLTHRSLAVLSSLLHGSQALLAAVR